VSDSSAHNADRGDIDRIEIELRVTADDLDPDRITRMLGVVPSTAARKDESGDVDGVAVIQPTGVWRYALPASPEWELSDAIDTLLEQMPPDPALWESLSGWANVSVICGLYVHDVNRGADLHPDTLAKLSERRVALRLEIRS
jgi:hypothetical protein